MVLTMKDILITPEKVRKNTLKAHEEECDGK
jgi:hypothetical protein